MGMKAQSRPKQPVKRKPTRGSWPKGVSGNPGGRKKGGDSFASVLRHYLAMTGPEVAQAARVYAKQFNALPGDIDLREMIVLRWIASAINEPTPGLLEQMIDRTDGPVDKTAGAFKLQIEYVNDWRGNHPTPAAAPGPDAGATPSAPVQPAADGPAMAQNDDGDVNRS